MLVLNFIPLALGYLLKCYKFHKQGFGEAWDKGMHEAFALLKSGRERPEENQCKGTTTKEALFHG